MGGPIGNVKVLTFDVGGTVFDWLSAIADRLAPVLAGMPQKKLDPKEFAIAVRAGFLELYGSVYRRERAFLPADTIFATVLDQLLDRFQVRGMTSSQHESLHQAWHAMSAWPSAREGIEALRKGFSVLPLTILSLPMTIGSSKVSGISWDGVLSCDLIGIYKPDPRCYTRVLEILGCQPHEVMMVAAHPSDLRGAIGIGYRSAFVQPRLHDPGEDYTDRGFASEFDIVARDFNDLALQLLKGKI